MTAAPTGRARRSQGWRVLIGLGWVAAAAAIVGLVAHYWTPGSVYTLGLAAVSPYLTLGSLVAVVLFALARGRAGWVGLIVAVAVLAWSVTLHVPAFVGTPVPPGRDVTVMTANLRLGQADPAAVVAAVRRHHVEVLLLEELPDEETAALDRAGLHALLPYSVAAHGRTSYGTALFSRYPLRDARADYDFRFGLVTATVQVPGVAAAPTVVGLHMFGPYPDAQTPGWVDDITRLRPFLRDLPRSAPVVVGGDFNATPDVTRFRDLLGDGTGGYADGAAQAGAGLTPTWPADRWWGPLITIDHVLTRGGAVARTADSVAIAGSDHRALVVTVRLPGSTG